MEKKERGASSKTQRKDSRDIREKILQKLKEGPKTIKKLSEETNSSWITITSHIDELKEEGLLKEIITGPNIRIFAREDYPSYYSLSIDKETLNKCLFILAEIVREWKNSKKEIISKTTMQKIAVEIAKNNPNLNLPTLKFHYGKTLPVTINPCSYETLIKEYDVVPPQNYEEIKNIIKKELENHSNNISDEKLKQYQNHSDMKIYLLNEELKKDIEGKNLTSILAKIYSLIPTSKEYEDAFEIYSEFFDIVTFIVNTKEFSEGNERKEILSDILSAFEFVWKYLTSEFYFNDFKESFKEDETNSLLIETKREALKTFVKNEIENLKDYKNSLTFAEKDFSEEEKKILNIILEGADEE